MRGPSGKIIQMCVNDSCDVLVSCSPLALLRVLLVQLLVLRLLQIATSDTLAALVVAFVASVGRAIALQVFIVGFNLGKRDTWCTRSWP